MNRMLGFYVDCVGAVSLAGERIVLVEEAPNGNIIMRSPGDGPDGAIHAVITGLETSELHKIIDVLYGPPERRLVS